VTRNYSSTAVRTSLLVSIGSGDATLFVDSSSGYPQVPFFATINRGQSNQEVVLVTTVAGTQWTVTRGQDGHPRFAHEAGSTVEHVWTATDATDSAGHISATAGMHGLTAGQTIPQRVQAEIKSFIPVGTIWEYAGSTAPALWLFPQGQAVSRTTYSALFAVIGTTYGAGNGSTTFNLPDFRDRVLMGGGTLGATGGSSSVTLTTTHLPAHTHTGPSHSHSFSATTDSDSHTHTAAVRLGDNIQPNTGPFNNNNSNRLAAAGGSSGTVDDSSAYIGSDAHTHSVSGTTGSSGTGATGSAGSGAAVDITPRHVRVNFIIYAGV
jgi:microcystin-dependent protein